MGKDCVCSKTKDQAADPVITCIATLAGNFKNKNGTQFTASMSASGSGYGCHAAREAAQNSVLQTLKEFLEKNPNVEKNPTYTVETTCDMGCDTQQTPLLAQLAGNVTWKKGSDGIYEIMAEIVQQDGKKVFTLEGMIGVDGITVKAGQTLNMDIYPVPFRATAGTDGLLQDIMLWLKTTNNPDDGSYAVGLPTTNPDIEGFISRVKGRFALPADVAFHYGPAATAGGGAAIGTFALNSLGYDITFKTPLVGDSGTAYFDITLQALAWAAVP